MALEDRIYMRDPMYGSRKSITVILLVTLVVCYILQMLAFSYGPQLAYIILRYFFLTQESLRSGFVWQFLTFQFFHGGFLHIFFNGLALFFIGKALETGLTTRHWLQIYFGGGLFGGLFHALGSLALPFNFPTPVVGASAGVSSLLAAFCFLYPAQEICLWFFLKFPARFFFFLSLGLSALFIAIPTAGADLGLAHGAHFGGLIFGYAYVRWFLHSEWQMPDLMSFFRRKPKIFIHKPHGTEYKPSRGSDSEIPSEEYITKEVDPILDKISAHGIQSLTERERRILEAARARMARR